MRNLIDGGIDDPMPFDLIEHDADAIIVIDVVGAPTEVECNEPRST
ncbi:hypothetical protein X754_23475 [Mesorhizobium sp. LNJC403B00]|nr:hypothetical protein X754_23475 [Mesorhizobium sp. LNJC403B00]